MKIQSLILVGYRRLLHRGVNRFEYYPEHQQQIIIGSNMSGKSSVMRELSPLPATPADYAPGGSKTIVIEHHHVLYTLKSSFNSGGRHSFFFDDQEHNPGGTAAVQKALVEAHFSITQELFNVLIGKVGSRFVQMTPSSQRRYWIMKLSGDHLDHAMKVHATIKTKHREAVAVLKHTNKRIAEESRQLLADVDLENLVAQTDELKDEITTLMGQHQRPTVSSNALEQRYHHALLECQNALKSLLALPCKRPAVLASAALTNALDVEGYLVSNQAIVDMNNRVITDGYREKTKLQETINAITQKDVKSLGEMEDEFRGNADKIKTYQSTLKYSHPYNRDYSTLFETCYDSLVELFSEMVDNSDKAITKQSREETKQSLGLLKEKRISAVSHLNKQSHRLEHISQMTETQCPECKYQWRPGTSKSEVIKLTLTQTEYTKVVETLDKEIVIAEAFLEKINLFTQQWRRYLQISDKLPQYKALWDLVAERMFTGTAPIALCVLFSQWRTDCNTIGLIVTLEHRQQQLEVLMGHCRAIGEQGLEFHQSRVVAIDHDIDLRLQENDTLKSQSHEARLFLKQVTAIDAGTVKVGLQVKEMLSLLNQMVQTRRHEWIGEDIRDRQSSLAKLEQHLIQTRSVRAIIDDLTRSQQQMQVQVEEYEILLKELSPVSGLIADQLKGFIDLFVAEVNLVLSQIFTQEFTVHACGLDSGELDYKFPVTCHESSEQIPDIAETSSSQQDIVNFAFTLATYRFLGLTDYPLYLDELAPSLDEQHRINIMTFIKQYVELGRCNTLFMISHYDDAHYTFAGAEVCVMNEDNIINMPGVYNRHVKFG